MLSLKVQKDSITLSEYLESITVLHLSLIELKQVNLEDLNKFLGEISGDIFRNVTLKMSNILKTTLKNEKKSSKF